MKPQEKRKVEIAPSILAADFSRLGEQVKAVLTTGVDSLHVDVMDGHFVSSLSMGPKVIRDLRALVDGFGAKISTHLMIANPDRFLEEFVRAGSDTVIVHVETCPHLHSTIGKIRSLGALPGVSLNPATPLVMLEEVLADIDNVLIMSVEPGSGGQDFIKSIPNKISRLRRLLAENGLDHVQIAVDGGINRKSAAEAARAGADIFIAGTAVFNSKASVADNIHALRAAIAAGIEPLNPSSDRPQEIFSACRADSNAPAG